MGNGVGFNANVVDAPVVVAVAVAHIRVLAVGEPDVHGGLTRGGTADVQPGHQRVGAGGVGGGDERAPGLEGGPGAATVRAHLDENRDVRVAAVAQVLIPADDHALQAAHVERRQIQVTLGVLDTAADRGVVVIAIKDHPPIVGRLAVEAPNVGAEFTGRRLDSGCRGVLVVPVAFCGHVLPDGHVRAAVLHGDGAVSIVSGKAVGEVLVEEGDGRIASATQALGLGTGNLLKPKEAAGLKFLLRGLAGQFGGQLGGHLKGHQETGGEGKNVLHDVNWEAKITRRFRFALLESAGQAKGGPKPPFPRSMDDRIT